MAAFLFTAGVSGLPRLLTVLSCPRQRVRSVADMHLSVLSSSTTPRPRCAELGRRAALRPRHHHSMDYRSVVVVGDATLITDEAATGAVLDRVIDHVVPGRALAARPVLPMRMVAGAPEPDPALAAGIDVPDHVLEHPLRAVAPLAS